MGFDLLNRARFGARPVRLYRFQLQDAVWWFAQAATDVTPPGGATYMAAQIERDDVQLTAERAKDKIKIRLGYLRDPNANPIDVPVTQSLGDLWHPYVPSDTVRVMCLDWHQDDTDPPRMVWEGFVKQPSFTDVELELACEPISAIGEARGQGPRSQRACWKVPYSTGLDGCNLDPAAFEVTGEIAAIDGLTITVPEFAAAPLSLLQGEFRYTRTVAAHNGDIDITEYRTITAVDGADVTLLYGGAGWAVGLAVRGLPGCEGVWDSCEARSNTINFGGALDKPIKSPYDGESLSWG